MGSPGAGAGKNHVSLRPVVEFQQETANNGRGFGSCTYPDVRMVFRCGLSSG